MQELFQRLIQGHCISQFLFLRSSLRFLKSQFRIRRLVVFTDDVPCQFVLGHIFLFGFRFRKFSAFFFRVCQQIRHLFRLRGRLLISVIIFLLLGRRQRLILHLQFHSLIYILSLTKPEDQIITLFQTLCRHARFLIKLCQFICPFLYIL